MAVADPLPPMLMATSSPPMHSGSASAFSRYSQSARAPQNNHHVSPQPPFTLQGIALLLERGSPTDDLAYLTADYYSTSNAIVRTSGRTSAAAEAARRPFYKSLSFPKVKRDEPLKSCVLQSENEKLLRRAKSVRFADTQGLPLIEAIHQLSVGDSSYTENKIVPYSDSCEFQPVTLVSCRQSKQARGTDLPAASSKEAPRPVAKVPHSLLIVEPPTPPPLVAPPPAPLTQHSPTSATPHNRRVFRFSQPGSEPGFYERVSRDYVVLESARDEPRMIRGVIRVSNISYHKEVTVRWTHDRWRSFHDTGAAFSANDGHTDRFTFELPANGEDVEFALRYKCDGQEFWDNNRGKNYVVEGSR